MLAEAKTEAEQVLPRQHLLRHARSRAQLCSANEVFCRALPRPLSRTVESDNADVERTPRRFFGPKTGNQPITSRPTPHGHVHAPNEKQVASLLRHVADGREYRYCCALASGMPCEAHTTLRGAGLTTQQIAWRMSAGASAQVRASAQEAAKIRLVGT